jgi:AcrR family transcriptional regulator
MLSNITIQVNGCVYQKDPSTSELGRKIIAGGIDLIDELGFEAFTFRKLGLYIHSTEASIYRYFENKYKMLLYLTLWYWRWKEYKLSFALTNIDEPKERLRRAITLLTSAVREDGTFEHVNEVKLQRIVISESAKVYLHKDVDEINKEGVFLGYKGLVGMLGNIILEINPTYRYPHMLVSTILEGAHLQRFFAVHLPRLTNVREGEDTVVDFYNDLVFKAIG